MPEMDEGSQFATLRISQRMRLENQQLEGVHRRMQVSRHFLVWSLSANSFFSASRRTLRFGGAPVRSEQGPHFGTGDDPAKCVHQLFDSKTSRWNCECDTAWLKSGKFRIAFYVWLIARTPFQTSHVVHIFPPCEFSDHYLVDSASDFLKSIREHGTSYLFVVVTTVVQVM